MNYPPVRKKRTRPNGWRETATAEEIAQERRERFQTWKRNNPERYKSLVRGYNRKPYNRYRSARGAAKRRSIPFDLSKEEFSAMLGKPCHYCNGPTGPTGAGLDRVDNSRGYAPDNVVPCCQECNRIKGHTVSYEHAVAILGLLTKLRAG